jgi:predicted nucleic acid-binding protein
MAVFIDTGIFVALHNADDEFHQRSQELMKNALKNGFGRIFTSDYIIDEAITTALMRTKKHSIAKDLGSFIIESPRITKLWIEEASFQKAWKTFCTFKDKPLNFTDCTSIALIESTGIKQIMSFDSGFDGLIPRIC